MNIQPARSEFMQRTSGNGRIAVRALDGRTRLVDLYQQGAAKIRLPRHTDRSGLEAVVINTAGGLTGGDRLDWSASAAEGSSLTLTTQACEKVYRSAGGEALVKTKLSADSGAQLAWLPQETILFDQSRLVRDLEADLHPDARFLACEAVIFGRHARGESVNTGCFRDRWTIRCGGIPVHREDFRIGGPIAGHLQQPAVAAGKAAFATVLLAGRDAEDMLARVRGALRNDAEIKSGASALNAGPTGKLLARILAKDGYALRKALLPLLELLNGEAGLPRIWST